MTSEKSDLIVMAGPCSVESYDQIMRLADAVKGVGADYLRGGAFKPRTSAGEWTGYGEEALKWMRTAANENGLKIVTEILDPRDIPLFQQYGVELYQVGARNAQNQALLEALGEVNVPVLLKNGMNTTMKEWLGSAGRMSERNVMLCARGKNVDTDVARNGQDIATLAYLVNNTQYPIIFDPSHVTGKRELVYDVTMGAVAVGVDGIIVEVHDDPIAARTDGRQSITPKQLSYLVEGAREQRERYSEGAEIRGRFLRSNIPAHVDIYFPAESLAQTKEMLSKLLPRPQYDVFEHSDTGILTARLPAGALNSFRQGRYALGKIVEYRNREGESSTEAVLINAGKRRIKLSPYSADAVKARGGGMDAAWKGERYEFSHGFPGQTVKEAFLTMSLKEEEIRIPFNRFVLYRTVEE